MAKILVIFDSRTGNTEKMAFAVAEGARQINGVEVAVKKADQTNAEELLSADGIIMGSPHKKELDSCKELGKRVANLVAKLKM